MKHPAKWIAVLMLAGTALVWCDGAQAAPLLVEAGQPRAAIVIAPQPPRMVRLAAEELRLHVEKITGASLPIVAQSNSQFPLHIYVGQSEHTDRLTVSNDGLEHGAFRMVSGRDYLVLLGRDDDFVLPRFFLRSPSDLPEFLAEWDQATGEKWSFANGNLYKEYNGALNIWARDGRGSLNAVHEFLRMQGVRWYLPGELGEVIPQSPNLELPQIDKTVRPDFAIRFPYQYGRMFAHAACTRDEALWQLRMGWSQAAEVIGDFGMGLAHGMNALYERPEVRAAHPEYYLLANGRRDELKVGESRPCLSCPGLFQNNLKYARTMFDLIDAPLVSLMPQDGYGILCECDLCHGKGDLARGGEGHLSDYVWDYVNRAALELYKSHPDKKVSCGAYGAYLLPPKKIDRLSPNLIVTIAQNRGMFVDASERQKFVDLRQAWKAKLPAEGRIITGDYYLHARPFTLPHVPYFYPRTIAEDLQSLRGISLGDFIEVYRDPEGIASLAVDHLNLYVTSRFWWNADQDIEQLLDEYCTEYYGPAAQPMGALIDFAEENRRQFSHSAEAITHVQELLRQAQEEAPAGTVFARRVDLLAEYIAPLDDLKAQLARGRTGVPEATARLRDKAEIELDGKLNDKFWEGLPAYPLAELQTGKDPYMPTSFKVGWADDAIYFAIRCQDRDTKKLNVGTARNEDPSLWNGDAVEIEIETQSHAYYQFAINPAGAWIDLDRKSGIDTLWTSGAEVACHVGDDVWTAEVRIPVVGEEQALLNPRYGVAGRQPSQSYPWYFNVCRQRMRPKEREYSAFSPTSTASFHVVKKFGKLYVR
ncbi:MAG: DUF4838 domain-containing protein [Pirellulales bacterium]